LALERSSPSSELLFESGLLALHSGDHAKVVELWHECLTRTQRFESEIVQSSMFELPMKTLFEEVLPQNPEYLIRISQKYVYQGKRTLPNDLLLIHTRRVLKKADIEEQRRLFLSGEIERHLQNYKAAKQFYQAALDLDDNDVKCRLNYAICLQNTDDYEEAVKQLKICELTPGSHLPAVRGILKQVRNQRKKQF
jgi:tetratricopeptide (TPR) repeat protein